MSSITPFSARNDRGQLREDLLQSIILERLSLDADGYRKLEIDIAKKMQDSAILNGCSWRPKRPQKQIDQIIETTLGELFTSLPSEHPLDTYKAAINTVIFKLRTKALNVELRKAGKKKRQSVQPLQKLLDGPSAKPMEAKAGAGIANPLNTPSLQ